MKSDLRDITFTIPIRFDTIHRCQNLELVVNFINHHFDTNILVLESDKERHFDFIADRAKYIFQEDHSPNLHRTRLLNKMSKMSETPFIANYDADVLFKPSQYIEAMNKLKTNQSDMVFPYMGKFMECNRSIYFNKICDTLSVDWINENELHCNHPNSLGGAIFWRKESFHNMGMENENFNSWGWEDNERFVRALKFGVRIDRVPGILYHMSHDRLADSTPNNDHYNNNQREFAKVNGMNLSQLQQYMSTWEWLK